MTELHYETLRNDLEQMRVPEGRIRNMRWLADLLAVGRTTSGHFEVFIRGDELSASSNLVRRHMQHGDWMPLEGGEPFSATRIVLPQAPHFASIAAVIAVELLRAGINDGPGAQRAFSDVEPIIEMAIRRGALPEKVIVGLIGELTLLRQLFIANSSHPASFLRVLDFWQGWQESGRDFRIGRHSIEVKTTQASSSIHKFTGLHQVEPTLLPSGQMETLSILSVGLAASTTVGEALPQLVDDILTTLSHSLASEEIAEEFLRRVSLYGQSGRGYEHATMRNWSAYSVQFAHTFEPRLYRVDDQAFAMLTRDMLSKTFVQTDDLSFTAHFPDQVSAFNPVPNWETELQNMQSE
jgi:hypothetical protein